jgi:hypothetical protein
LVTIGPPGRMMIRLHRSMWFQVMLLCEMINFFTPVSAEAIKKYKTSDPVASHEA